MPVRVLTKICMACVRVLVRCACCESVVALLRCVRVELKVWKTKESELAACKDTSKNFPEPGLRPLVLAP